MTDWQGSNTCSFALYDPATGTELDFGQAVKAQGVTLMLESGGKKTAFVETTGCGFHVSAGT